MMSRNAFMLVGISLTTEVFIDKFVWYMKVLCRQKLGVEKRYRHPICYTIYQEVHKWTLNVEVIAHLSAGFMRETTERMSMKFGILRVNRKSYVPLWFGSYFSNITPQFTRILKTTYEFCRKPFIICKWYKTPRTSLSSGVFPRDFSTQILYTFLVSSGCATCK
jgi:hypothetical protein